MGARLAKRLGRADLITAVAAVVLATGATELVAGALATGVTVDEPSNVDWITTWVGDGTYAPDPFTYVYGPAYEALAHGANTLAGNESLDSISRSAPAYDARHLTVAALALLTVAAVGAAVRRLTGSGRFALWAAAALLAVPAWTGHGFFNPKDVPSACGYTLVTVALMLALAGGAGGRFDRHQRILIGVMLAGGVFIGAGTRLALWLPIAASALTYAALRVGQRRFGEIILDRGTDLTVLAGIGSGFGAIALLYPKVLSEPFTFLTESVSGSSEFDWGGITLTAGELLAAQPPWWYLPAWVAASVPLLLGALAVLGGVLGIRALAQARPFGPSMSVWARPELGLVLVLQQALLVSAGAVVTGATMYDGVRQHLYVLPALVILAGFGAERFWAWAQTRKPERRWRALATGVMAAALVVPMAEQTLLFPYNYAYVNPLAGASGVNDRWETDYWFASAPEGISRTPRDSELLCTELLASPETLELIPCAGDGIEAFLDRRGDAVDERWKDDTATWAVGIRRGGNRPPEQCEEVDDVTRWLRGERVRMSYVLRCDP